MTSIVAVALSFAEYTARMNKLHAQLLETVAVFPGSPLVAQLVEEMKETEAAFRASPPVTRERPVIVAAKARLSQAASNRAHAAEMARLAALPGPVSTGGAWSADAARVRPLRVNGAPGK